MAPQVNFVFNNYTQTFMRHFFAMTLVIYYPAFAPTNTYVNLAPCSTTIQRLAFAARGFAMLCMDKCPYLHQQTDVNDIYMIL